MRLAGHFAHTVPARRTFCCHAALTKARLLRALRNLGPFLALRDLGPFLALRDLGPFLAILAPLALLVSLSPLVARPLCLALVNSFGGICAFLAAVAAPLP